MIGEVRNHYRVVELLGCGAMGIVYKAVDVSTLSAPWLSR